MHTAAPKTSGAARPCRTNDPAERGAPDDAIRRCVHAQPSLHLAARSPRRATGRTLVPRLGVLAHPIAGVHPEDDGVLDGAHRAQRLAGLVDLPLVPQKRFVGEEKVLAVLHVVTGRWPACSRRNPAAHRRGADGRVRGSRTAIDECREPSCADSRRRDSRCAGPFGHRPGCSDRWPNATLRRDEAGLEVEKRLVCFGAAKVHMVPSSLTPTGSTSWFPVLLGPEHRAGQHQPDRPPSASG